MSFCAVYLVKQSKHFFLRMQTQTEGLNEVWQQTAERFALGCLMLSRKEWSDLTLFISTSRAKLSLTFMNVHLLTLSLVCFNRSVVLDGKALRTLCYDPVHPLFSSPVETHNTLSTWHPQPRFWPLSSPHPLRMGVQSVCSAVMKRLSDVMRWSRLSSAPCAASLASSTASLVCSKACWIVDWSYLEGECRLSITRIWKNLSVLILKHFLNIGTPCTYSFPDMTSVALCAIIIRNLVYQ